MKFYNQKVCVITGAASGIGRACALALASYGAKTVITDIRKDMLDGIEGTTLAVDFRR